MKKVYYTWNDIEHMCIDISLKMFKDKWLPDYIVGITRGGNVPCTIISNMLDVPGHTLKVSLRDDNQMSETKIWMINEAFGLNDESITGTTGCRWDIKKRKNILIVDDINDTGATFNWIKNNWMQECYPQEKTAWDSIWHKNVKFAALTYNLVSEAHIDYWGDECNKLETPTWQVYPWEVVGKHEV